MTKPWMENWVAGPFDELLHEGSSSGPVFATQSEDTMWPERSELVLAAAAPAMARTLAIVEWAGGAGMYQVCPACLNGPGAADEAHAPDCALDLALTQAGLSPQDRAAVRATVGR